ncbi:sensor histidine kinase [Thioclava sp. A2]|uniref:sensor histidine kinase n=1 Tax=Thioclava sp. FCG-A2 TaxID=3080562 RepID=UPI00295496DB|nr:ATP-binding protein [Thioclava sp. A2]
MLTRFTVLAIALAAMVAGAAEVWMLSAREGLGRLEDRAQADLRLAADRLVTALAQYREVAVLAAEHPYVASLARDGGGAIAPEAVAAVLRRMADRAGARDILLLAPDGRVLAGPEGAPERLPLTPELARAAQGASGMHHHVEPETARRLFTFSAPVFEMAGPVAGIVLLRIEADRVEAQGRGDPVPVWFSDAQGVTFLANRLEMVFEVDRPVALLAGDYPSATPLRRVHRPVQEVAGFDLVTAGGYLPELGLPVTQDLPVIGMTGHALADAQGVLNTARTLALAAALGGVGIVAVILALWERRRTLAARLEVEARANAALEMRVSERTAELSTANEQLKRTQAELVQAGKLSALGQMSAGISHELNQPLMAIGSYAENAELLLERGRKEEAAENLSRIADLSRRMGRIIRNLRAFARQEAEPATRVGLAAVVESALEIAQMRLERAGVTVDWRRPDFPAIVMAGEVRLSQVVVNLLANAADAMADSLVKRVDIRITRPAKGRIALVLRDSGPGIREPDRIFDPFYSTKEVGSAEGMGLGLSISYGLVQGFGGSLTGGNAPDGGAVFTVELNEAPAPMVDKEHAA